MTEGQYRVGISFNPSNKPEVDAIKATIADLIDQLNTFGAMATQLDNSGAARCASIAMTELESAAMWAVKAFTKSKKE
jgi:predicted MarR family transcription regulator